MVTAEKKSQKSERVENLKKKLFLKGIIGGGFPAGVRLCVERARLITESYRRTESEPPVIRAAKAMEYTLANMTIFIKDSELIVGYDASAPNRVTCCPETGLDAFKDALTPESRKYVDVGDRKEIRKVIEYWQDRCLRNYIEGDPVLKTGEGKALLSHIVANCTTSPNPLVRDMSGGVIDFEFILKHGLNGIIKIIEGKMEAEKKRVPKYGPEYVEALEKFHEWEAMIIACRAMINWALRYAELASFMAEHETDAHRKDELKKIAEVCNKVPANPPEHLWESLQFQWFLVLVDYFIVANKEGGIVTRIDQLHWPYYEHDVLQSKVLSEEEAVELLALFRLKFSELGRLIPKALMEQVQGVGSIITVTIGGVKSDGSDACNALTEAVLSSCLMARVALPSLVLRYRENMPAGVKYLSWQCLSSGLPLPSFVNDEVQIENLMGYGLSLEEARNWAVQGCCNAGLAIGVGLASRAVTANLFPAKCLELALNDGVEIYPGHAIRAGSKLPQGVQGIRLGPSTGNAEQFGSYKEVVEAFRKQIGYAVGIGQRLLSISRYHREKYLQPLSVSSLSSLAVDREGEQSIVCPSGTVDAGDSLVALKKLVFDEKKYTMKEVLNALRQNWEGYEEMQQDFLKAPKWGNDDDYADMVVKQDGFELIGEEVAKIKSCYGVTPRIQFGAVANWWSQGMKTGALPNGRSAGEGLADAGLSPWYGMDKKGPTAVLKTCSKLNHRLYNGTLLNQKLAPEAIEGEKGFGLLFQYLDAWHRLGLQHVQLNIVNGKTLRDAQKHPERHSDLLVRVAGYVAPFIQLRKDIQDYIIARTEQKLG